MPTIKTRAAKFAIAWLKRAHPYLLREAVVGPNAHVHLNPPKKALRAEYIKEGE
jgi:hypothetical protein